MTRAEKAVEVRCLRDDEGLYWREIGERLGISKTYAATLYFDPDGSLDRARKASYGGTCVDCGKRTDGSNGPTAAPERCSPCANRHNNTKWSREAVVAAIRRFAGRYGRQPCATDFNPGAARRYGHDWRAERYYSDGDYPSQANVQIVFGSWNSALSAAGFEPLSNGYYPRTSHETGHAAGAHLNTERRAA